MQFAILNGKKKNSTKCLVLTILFILAETKTPYIMSKKTYTRKENLIYGGAAYLLVAIGITAMIALYELIENLFNLPV